MTQPDGTESNVEMQSLHPNVKKVWLFSSLVSTTVFVGIVVAAEYAVSRSIPQWPLPTLQIGGIVALVFYPLALIMPRLQFERWGYAIRPDDVLVEYGVVWRIRRCVPRLRIQHVDINSGPIDRMLGLVHMSVYTAGSMGAVATIPGMTPVRAEAIREQLIGTKAPDG